MGQSLLVQNPTAKAIQCPGHHLSPTSLCGEAFGVKDLRKQVSGTIGPHYRVT